MMDFESYRDQFFHYYREFYQRSDSYKRLGEELGNFDWTPDANGNYPLPEGALKLYGKTPLGRIRQHRGDGVFHLPPVNAIFSIAIDITLGLDAIENQLRQFSKDVLKGIRQTKDKLKKESPPSEDKFIDLIDFIRDKKSGIDYFSLKKGEPFSLWERALRVYDLKQPDKTWISIANELGIWGNTANCRSTATTIIKRAYSLADRLIKSAGAGTFPG